MTSASAKALLSGIIDYAGLFPPARLPLEQAIRNYARYRTGAQRQMLGRFVVPAARLAELSPFMGELFSPDVFLELSIVGGGGQTRQDFLAGLPRDVEDMVRFHAPHRRRAEIRSIELRLPPDLAPGAELDLIRDAYERPSYQGQHPPTLFLELASGTDWRSRQESAIEAIGRFNEEVRPGRPIPTAPCGFKLRCGGSEPGSVPSPGQVVGAIYSCLASRVPFKATAGLHHPLRRLDPALGVPTHGFLNLFGMGTLAFNGQLNPVQAVEMLTDEDPGNFVFDDTGFLWKDRRTTVADIHASRLQLLISFGSCSFDEPCEDLRALELLA
jgi:hypothetical protein